MADDIVLYHNPRSRAVMAHWMLEEVGASYRLAPIDFEAGENRTPEFLAINPMGKLPTLVHNGVVVTETAAIIAYLADAFPDAGLAPAIGDPARGTYLRWLIFGAGCIEPALVDKMFDRPDVRHGAVGYGSYADTFNALETALTPGPWILGERFSAADLYLSAELFWAMMFGAPDIKTNKRFTTYVARASQRPAYKRVFGDQAQA